MPLSEHEQRQLEQIEQALYADHPRLVKVMRAKDPKVHYHRRLLVAAAGFLVGIGLVVAGVVTGRLLLSAGGGVVLALGGALAIMSYRRLASIMTLRKARRARLAPRPRRGAMMERLEERWRRRQERGF